MDGTGTWGTPLVTGCQADWTHKDSLGQDRQPVFTQLTVDLPKPQAASFSSRILWESIIGNQVSQGGHLLTFKAKQGKEMPAPYVQGSAKAIKMSRHPKLKYETSRCLPTEACMSGPGTQLRWQTSEPWALLFLLLHRSPRISKEHFNKPNIFDFIWIQSLLYKKTAFAKRKICLHKSRR